MAHGVLRIRLLGVLEFEESKGFEHRLSCGVDRADLKGLNI